MQHKSNNVNMLFMMLDCALKAKMKSLLLVSDSCHAMPSQYAPRLHHLVTPEVLIMRIR